ncbi:membrane-spanning 4-domains subfamily A member 8-like [Tiliqua scincoides]|uniref:membrane-spanning 4-domains subfamily A member 8-like n=1 Tax=Tiliqua scincoides TaxID=71010 RepID=UPI00346371E0
MATDPARTANGIMLFIPANGTNIIHPGQRIPGTMIQPPGMAQYVGQEFGSSSNRLKRSRCVTAFEKFLKVETKTLGAIQILIGLIHIGLGGASIPLVSQNYFPMTAVGGYPFWGGLFFIASGSLSVSAAKHFNNGLMKCSLGMNITSAVIASIGIIQYLILLGLHSRFYVHAYFYDGQSNKLVSAGLAIGVLLLLFSVLEFSITALAAHFGCQATCCNTDTGMVVLPCTVAEDGVTLLEANPTVPADNAADSSPNAVV